MQIALERTIYDPYLALTQKCALKVCMGGVGGGMRDAGGEPEDSETKNEYIELFLQ